LSDGASAVPCSLKINTNTKMRWAGPLCTYNRLCYRMPQTRFCYAAPVEGNNHTKCQQTQESHLFKHLHISIHIKIRTYILTTCIPLSTYAFTTL
jgi:hypothetical protein